MRFCSLLMLGLLAALAAPSAWAHKPSDSYLIVQADSSSKVLAAQWDIALRDLEVALQLDANRDGVITWGEVRTREADLFAYAFTHLRIQADGSTCRLAPDDLLIDDHSDGAYAVLKFKADCAAVPRSIDVGYSLLFDIDPSHRGLLRLDVDGNSRSAVLSPDHAVQTFALAETSRLATFLQFVEEGIHHIWIGYDHMLFLISLLLPSVLLRRNGEWVPVGTLRSALLSVLAIVTAFTVSHSITLTLSALGVIGLPSRLVESGIALSVLLAALNNIWPQVTRRAWLLAFGFGLVHGFGFASVLADLGLPQGALAWSLAGFNIGVEIGQLSVVLVVVPAIFLLRERRFYRPLVLVSGSCVIAAVAGIWLMSRALGFGLG
ncbi:MAG: HupE/UreJ family protein [Rudaea sp.]|uniref:HupE/UreJ family protein n=1 Tax=Rudaea sp. 3F27F6 TaxID=2502208 RepID=UPI0010F82AD2|nr:HupE/UreJ family protein [Rudaea sp. 3F27F6]MBR0345243.1 HupE/UreJ family protein [Rudaea sp.]